MKRIAIAFICSMLNLWAFSAYAASATFTADTTTELHTNNERGFYIPVKSSELCDGSMVNWRDNGSSGAGNQKARLFYYDFLPGSSLVTLATNLACARAAGVKVIFAPVYCDVQFCNEGVTISQAEAHISDLKTTLYAYRDVLHVVRMGTIGAWGEWADSGAGLDTAANKIRVRNAYLSATPPEIPIVTRKPWDVMAWYPNPISLSNAFSGSGQSRIGLQNDCFMSSATDGYSFPGPATVVDLVISSTAAQQRAYLASTTRFAPMGGETCGNIGGQGRLTCAGGTDNVGQSGGIMNEGPRYYLTYLNRAYDQNFHNTWISGGCYADVNNLMGYRFQFDSIVHADTMTHNTTGTFTVTMRNYGWSRILSPRQLQVRLVKGGASDIVCKFTPQLRTLAAQATTSTALQSKCFIPNAATTGSYAVHLEIPDVYAGSGTAYKIQPANANSGGQTWDSTNRRWTTGTTVTVN